MIPANKQFTLPSNSSIYAGCVAPGGWSTPSSVRAALMGDSLTTHRLGYNWSPFFWINGLAGGPLQLVANAGVSGDTVSMMLARVDNAYTNAAPGMGGLGTLGHIFVRAGTNDARAGTPISALAAGYTALLNKIAPYASKVYILSVPSIGPTESGYAAKNALTQDYNTWLAAFAAANPSWCVFINDSGNMRAGDGSQLAGFVQADGIHNAGAGTQKEGIDAFALLASKFAGYGYPAAAPDAALAEWFTNPTFAGTSGTVGSTLTGQVVTGLAIGASGGNLAALSIEAATDGGTPWQVITPSQTTRTGAGEAIQIASTLSGRPVTATDPATIEMMVELDFVGFDTNYFSSATLWVQGSGGSGANLSEDMVLKMGGGPTTQRVLLRSKMPRPNTGANTTETLYFYLYIAANFTGAMGKIRFRRLSVRG